MRYTTLFFLLLSLLTSLLTPVSGLAASPTDIAKALDRSREKMVELIRSSDIAAETALIDEVKRTSDVVDTSIDAVLADTTLSEEVRKNVMECKTVWEESKHTRDSEVIPAILAGNPDAAKKLARNIQAPRFKKMQSLLK